MHLTPVTRWLAMALLVVAYARSGYAQTILVVEYHKRPTVVRGASGSRPIVEVDGKRSVAIGDRYALKKVEEFYPVFVSLRNLNVKTTAVALMGSGDTINNQFEFRGEFVSSYALENVFFVLELEPEDGHKSLFLHEIGRLEPHRPRTLSLVVPMSFPLGRGKYHCHIYTDGLEVLHSQQPFAFREGMLDKMVAKRVAGRKDGPPEFFVGPLPEYPRKLAKSKVKGRVLVNARVRGTGAVVDAKIVEADDPAFGEAALEAVRQWRFLPAMKNGHAVDKAINLPVLFEPELPEAVDAK